MLKKALRYKQEEYPKLRHKKTQNEELGLIASTEMKYC